jgi:hypothetical protein
VESIARLAERLPEDRVEHNIANLPKVIDPNAVQRSDEPVGEIARGIETNGCWMVLKNIESDPEYKRLLDDSLDEVAPYVRRDGGMTEREGFIFLSAPGSMTPSHTDPEHNFLMQIRGTKEMNVGCFPDPETEQLVLEHALGGSGHRNVDWEPHDPVRFDLRPGDGVYVHPHAPHWVQNGQQVSVSLSVTFATLESEDRRRIHSMNARLRRLGLSPAPPGHRPRLDRRKAACSRALGRLRHIRS